MIDILYFFIKALIVFGLILMLMALKRKKSSGANQNMFAPVGIEKVNETFTQQKNTLMQQVFDKKKFKNLLKSEKKPSSKSTKNFYVIDFQGDMKATGTKQLRQLISMVLSIAHPKTDHVIVRLDSRGGTVTGYGLAAAQLKRLTDNKIKLSVTIDEFAASGGYMMAAVADKIYASPFSMIGSIGVVASMPNFHKLLQKNDIDYELITAGKYKRTLTMLGENTNEDREKFRDDLEKIHLLFMEHVKKHRPHVKDDVFTGEVWPALLAKDKNLIDELMTSDELIQKCLTQGQVYHLTQRKKISPLQKLTKQAAHILKRFDQNNFYMEG